MGSIAEPETEACQGTPGKVAAVSDRNRCAAKEDCVRVCPYHVFEVQPLTPVEKRTMSMVGRLKAVFHGNRQAFVVRPAECHACQLCVAACPEQAITLAAYRPEQ